MSKKSKKSSMSKKMGTSSENLYSEEYGNYDEAFSTECQDCCCFDCSELDLTAKINFSLDNLCCNLGPYPFKDKKKTKSTKRKKSKKKIGPSSETTSSEKNTEEYDVKLTVPPKSFNLDQLKFTNRSFSTNDLPGFKGSSSLKTKKLKSHKKSTKLCNSLKADAPESLKNLCDRFKSSSLTNLLPISRKNTVKTLINLSDHDKKILDRMSMKNLKEIAFVENAMMARKYWEDEKSERDKLKYEQQMRYIKMVNQKRVKEQAELARRRHYIEEKNKEMSEKILNDIEAKMIRSENILKNIEMEREISECRKRQKEYQRIEALQSNCEEKNLDEQLWRESICEKLEEKIHKAENTRSKNLDVYRIRIQTDNQIHQQIHGQNYEEVLKEETRKKKHLKHRIEERDGKFKKFAEQKEKFVEQSKAQAKTSALLRELVRKSFGFKGLSEPVSYQRSVCNDNGRFSNCSYSSQVSHIHLS
ncbi:hypothetical protein ACKWTF_007805 [Chironomus riparius]